MTKTQQCDIYKNLLSVIILPEEHSLKDTCMCKVQTCDMNFYYTSSNNQKGDKNNINFFIGGKGVDRV
jgi:hypothetical protein